MRLNQSNKVNAALKQKVRRDVEIVAIIFSGKKYRQEKEVPHCWTVKQNPVTGAIECRP